MSPKFVVPPTFTIPDTIEGVTALLTVRGWEKAAIVWAFTSDKRKTANTGAYGIGEFTELGITGLKNHETVQLYRDRWQTAIEEGVAAEIAPGDIITVPDLPWPPTAHANTKVPTDEYVDDYQAEAEAIGVNVNVARRTGANKAAITAAIKADPAVRIAARDAIDEVDHKQAVAAIVIRDPRPVGEAPSPLADLVGISVAVRKTKRALQEILGQVVEFKDNPEMRDVVNEYVEELQKYLDAIRDVAQGDSMDVELSRLLEEGAR